MAEQTRSYRFQVGSVGELVSCETETDQTDGDCQISWQHTNRRQDSFVIEGLRQDLEGACRSLPLLPES